MSGLNVELTANIEQVQRTLDAFALACKDLLKLECEGLRESCNIFLELLDGSINFDKIFRVNANFSANGADKLLISLDLTDGAIYLLLALRAINGNGMIVDDAHRKLLVDRLLGDVNPTTGSSSVGGAP